MSAIPSVHQFVPNLEPGAVGAHTRLVRDALRAAGHESEIFTAEIHAACSTWAAHDYRDYGRSYPARRDDRLVYQMAIGSVVADYVLSRPQPLIVNHHNLTPLRYFHGWEPVAAHGVVWGRHQLRALGARAALGIADSQYNEAELVETGYRATKVVPLLLDPTELTRDPDPQLTKKLRADSDGASRWLFVGRLAPNKAQHDVVKAFAAYHRFHDPNARLDLVGGGRDGTYGRTLEDFVAALDLTHAVDLVGSASPEALAAYYAAADVFVSCSEHEGFCAPLIEAMNRDVPVVAFAAAAVPETAGNAALLLDAKTPDTVATAVRRVLTDDALREQMIRAGQARVRRFAPAVAGAEFVAAVANVEST